jgi:hypothetical protein
VATNADQTASTQFTYATAVTQYAQTGGTRYAYRRIGRSCVLERLSLLVF